MTKLTQYAPVTVKVEALPYDGLNHEKFSAFGDSITASVISLEHYCYLEVSILAPDPYFMFVQVGEFLIKKTYPGDEVTYEIMGGEEFSQRFKEVSTIDFGASTCLGHPEDVLHPYGRCPKCGSRGWSRERRPNGNDTCVNGHTYPSKDAVIRMEG